MANGANILHDSVYNECRQNLGFWGGTIGHIINEFACFFHDPCDNAADQVVNCMSTNICDDNNHDIWHHFRDDPSTVAFSISPDRIVGRSPHPSGNGQWSSSVGQNVTWSSGGAIYGCWK